MNSEEFKSPGHHRAGDPVSLFVTTRTVSTRNGKPRTGVFPRGAALCYDGTYWTPTELARQMRDSIERHARQRPVRIAQLSRHLEGMLWGG